MGSSKKLVSVLDLKDALNNVLAPLSLDIDEVFFLYHHEIEEEILESIRSVILKYRDIGVHFYSLNNDNEEISVILETYPDIIVDIGGEKYLSLVLFDRVLPRDNMIIYYDNEENMIKSYRNHEIVVKNVFRLSIEDMVRLGGGFITDQMHASVRKEDRETVEVLDRVMEASFGSYSRFTGFLSRVASVMNKDRCRGGRIYTLDDDAAKRLRNDEGYRTYEALGLLELDRNTLSFPTREIASMFGVTGAFLENYLYLKLKESGYFDDVRMSCVIDFNKHLRKYPVVCEIDCLVIKDNHILFVSCKSNKVDTGDLNEIKVHDTMFGNRISHPVLCTLDDLNVKSPSVYSKARELDVAIIDSTDFEKGEVPLRFLEIIRDTYDYERIG